MTDPTQIPNLEAANEHLHRQLAVKDARVRELEAEVQQLRSDRDYWQRLVEPKVIMTSLEAGPL